LSTPVLVIIGVVLAVSVFGVIAYNGLVQRRNRVDSTWSDIDVLLRRRHDLVPNLVSAVSGYAGHEQAALRIVAETRAAAIGAQGPAARGDVESALDVRVKSVLAVAEAYPELKASASFVDLQRQLGATEDGLEHARQFYNDSVFGYNNAIQTLPTSVVAALFGFHLRQFFQAAAAERTSVSVRP